MKKKETMFIKNLRYLCLICVISLGLITILGSNGRPIFARSQL